MKGFGFAAAGASAALDGPQTVSAAISGDTGGLVQAVASVASVIAIRTILLPLPIALAPRPVEEMAVA
ncbi:MAG: hypothetical protein WCJ64_23155 [Rhodospirillaceae bacterium]